MFGLGWSCVAWPFDGFVLRLVIGVVHDRSLMIAHVIGLVLDFVLGVTLGLRLVTVLGLALGFDLRGLFV